MVCCTFKAVAVLRIAAERVASPTLNFTNGAADTLGSSELWRTVVAPPFGCNATRPRIDQHLRGIRSSGGIIGTSKGQPWRLIVLHSLTFSKHTDF